jgi:predicted metal-dependent peptidase
VAIDTSGSIGEDDIQLFMSETLGILRSRKVRKLRLLSCDADVSLDEELDIWDELPAGLKGGGGTDFRPVFESLSEGDELPTCLIYFTDLMGTFPEERPAYPVLWLTPTEEYEVPFGVHIHFNPDSDLVEIKSVN